jgi:hypothetical protein
MGSLATARAIARENRARLRGFPDAASLEKGLFSSVLHQFFDGARFWHQVRSRESVVIVLVTISS